MRNKQHGFAMMQVMVLMVFLSLFISVTLITSANNNARVHNQEAAVTAFSAAYSFINYAMNETSSSIYTYKPANSTTETSYNYTSNQYYQNDEGSPYTSDLTQLGFDPDHMSVNINTTLTTTGTVDTSECASHATDEECINIDGYSFAADWQGDMTFTWSDINSSKSPQAVTLIAKGLADQLTPVLAKAYKLSYESTAVTKNSDGYIITLKYNNQASNSVSSS